MIYLDASALVPLVVTETSTPDAMAYRERHRALLVVSDLAFGEVAAALSRLVRMSILQAADAEERWLALRSWPGGTPRFVELDSADMARATDFVRMAPLGLRLPDALHIALCERHGFTLVTLDQRLLTAARSLSVDVETF